MKLRHDKKTHIQVQYNAMLKLAHMSFGRVSEIMDLKRAIFNNIKINIGGMWWTLGSLSQSSKELALKGVYNGKYQYVVDWQGTARDLLANEIIDRHVGKLSQLERNTWLQSGMYNTLGNPSSWLNRI